ncbi:hypothetical protein J7M23_06895, partial [Candidatus Sumerlaeota bacterium]|nr:hypothetical protein [Candidatus Sumerlaeota bacterium]
FPVFHGEIERLFSEDYHSWIEWYTMDYIWMTAFKTVLGYAYYYYYTGDEHYKKRVIDYIDNCVLGGSHPFYNPKDNWFYSVYDFRNKKYDYWAGGQWGDAEGRTYPVPFVQAEGIQILLTGYMMSGDPEYLRIAESVGRHTIEEMELMCYSGGSWVYIPQALVFLYKVTKNRTYLDGALKMIKKNLSRVIDPQGLLLGREWMGLCYMTPALLVAQATDDQQLKYQLKEWLDRAIIVELSYYKNKTKEIASFEIAHTIMALITAGEVFPEQKEKYLSLAEFCWQLVKNNKFYFDYYDYPESTDAFLTAHIWSEFLCGILPEDIYKKSQR